MAGGISGPGLTGLLRDVVLDVVEAIGDELQALATESPGAVDIRNGRFVGATGPDRLWSFELDGGLPVPPETPARITIPDRDPLPATILAISDLDLVLGVREELGEHVPRARLSAEPWFIYDTLRNRLSAMAEGGVNTVLLDALLDLVDLTDDSEPSAAASGAAEPSLGLSLGADQTTAIPNAIAPGLRFVWGPPGTGKTATLAAAVRALATGQGHPGTEAGDGGGIDGEPSRPRRALVLAHANAAVDVAMVRIAEMLEGSDLLASGRVLRIGTPQLEQARNRTDILPDQIIARQQPELVARQDELRRERRALSRQFNAASADPATPKAELEALARRLDSVRAEQSDIEKRLREARVTLVNNAAVVGTTLSKLAIDDLLWHWPSDAVVVDEASMSGLPFLVALALRGAETLTCLGDFRQLPPIAVSQRERAQRWLARDVFELSGVVSRIEDRLPDPRLAVLRTQYRMGEDIARVVGRLAYFDLLETDPTAAAHAAEVARAEPHSGRQIVLVDTSDLGATCQREADLRSFSRFNVMSAALASSLATDLLGGGAGEVGVVTPYRAQARLLQALVREAPSITAATTHKFQGSERDAIVLDLVDANPQEGPSRLTGGDVDLALRLLNVAASRARGKLFLIADLEFLEARHALTSPARNLVRLAQETGAPTVRAAELIRGCEDRESSLTWDVSWENALADALSARTGTADIDLNIPDAEVAEEWLVPVATDLLAKGSRMIVRAPAPVAVQLEDAAADLKLRTLLQAPLAFVGEDVLVAGGGHAEGPAVRIISAAVVSALRRLLLPSE